MENNNSIEKGKVNLEMLSDWHIGTGSGIPGGVDALLVRDADGFPCVPAKTQVGIWRDALETLTYGLDDGDQKNKVWQNWVDVIFGSQPNIDKNPNETPRPAILSIQPARLDENLRNAIENSGEIDRTKYKQALTFVKANTQIESESGTAKKDSLRFTEMGRIGSILETEFALDFENFDDDEKHLIKALLTASANLVERIGGNRRRGAGKCAVQILDILDKSGNKFDLTSAVTTIEGYKGEDNKEKVKGLIEKILSRKNEENDPKVSDDSDGEQKEVDVKSSDDSAYQSEIEPNKENPKETWKRIEFSLALQTPVAIVTETLGNVSETLDFIPGTYLLPHITKNLSGISEYVASGDFQVLPATIEVEGNRGLAVPKVIHYHKVEGGFDKEHTIYNRLEDDISGSDQKKNYREGYVSSLDEHGKLPFYETTKKILLMHNTVEDEVQRPTENVGGVFSRQAIQAGQVLKGEVRFRESIGESLDFSKLGGFVRLGTSKKDDYGLADLKFEAIEDSTSTSTAADKLIVYLASDVLLRNDNLRQTNLVEDLRKLLEKKLSTTPEEKDSITLKEKDSLIQVRRIESWHEGWGFPRPTLTAMAAGSVVVFEIVGTIDPTKLQNLELSGIGERRGEGYGQIKFNPKIVTEEINGWAVPLKIEKQESETNVVLKTGETAFDLAFQIEKNAWRKQIENKVLVLAGDYTWREENLGWTIKGEKNLNTNQKAKETKPNSSQAGSLRSIIQSLQNPRDVKVIGWLDHLEATENRRNKWTKESLTKLRQIINQESEIWKLLGDSFPKQITENSKDKLQLKLWAEAVKSLFDAAARAHKRTTEDK